MTEKDRILELVQQGIISPEEGIDLLEQLGKKETQAASQAEPAKEASAEDLEAQDRKQLDKILEGIASAMTSLSASADETSQNLQYVEKEIAKKEERLSEIATIRQLGDLSVELEMEGQRLEEEISVLTSQKEALNAEKKAIFEEMKQVKKEELDENLQKLKKKVTDRDWKQTTNDSIEQVSGLVGKFANSFSKALTETIRNVSETISNEDGVWTSWTSFSEKHPFHLVRDIGEASVLVVKLANGSLKLKTAPQDQMTIEGQIRVSGNLEDQSIEDFIGQRLHVTVDEEQITIDSSSKRISADLVLVLPEKDYDYVSLKSLNGDFKVKDLHGKDFNLHSTNGDIALKNVSGTMLEATTTNGDLKFVEGQFKDVIMTSTNGDVVSKAAVENGQFKTVNGDVKVKGLHADSKHFTAQSTNGNVALRLSKDLGIEADLQTSLGQLRYQADSYEVLNKENATTSKKVTLRRVTTGLPVKITAKTTTGTIALIEEEQ